jgi:transcription initiation factor TFIIE subunit alpha
MQTLNTVKKLDADAVMVVSELVGEHALSIVGFLVDKEKISEFIIAEELGLEINETRNILYKLFEHNIVTFLRKKDKIKGWYICYWDYNPNMIPYLKHKILAAKLERMQSRLSQEEEGQYFICKHGCTRLTFENAVEQNFKCNECGNVMQEQDNTRTKEFLRERITELSSQVKAAEPRRKVAMDAPVEPKRKAPARKAATTVKAVPVRKAVKKALAK